MITRSRWKLTAALVGGAALWGLLLISCTSVDRPLVAPPQIAGAQFVGSKACAECHGDTVKHFRDATHSQLMAQGANAKNIGCESCHGPGSLHVKAGGGAGNIINPGRSPETCFQCHSNIRAQFSLPNTHPVLSGQMTCTDCHNPHAGDAAPDGGAKLARLNETCLKCHNQQGGPFVFEHEAMRDGCVSCHQPHGSVNAKMLRVRNQNLCLQCHFQQQTATGQLMIGGRDHAPFVSRGDCWSAGCHEAVHGSHVNRSLRF
ncbi:MAG TPA: cytochrome c3 family protein [Opitutaceae bacterium]|nr:cytochrome c3 family protein [Opitutaceae bacterium]